MVVCDKNGENKAVSANLFLELGMGNSEIGIEYRTGNDHKFVWHIETWVIDKTVAISNILHFPQNRKSAREELTETVVTIYTIVYQRK